MIASCPAPRVHTWYRAALDVRAGEEGTLRATLTPESNTLYGRAWFWGAAAALVAGVAVRTYFATRPAPERPPPDGGDLDYVVRVP